MIADAISQIMEAAEKNTQIREGDFQDSEGLWVCGKCHTRKQTRIDGVFGMLEPFCMCQCEQEAYNAKEERRKRQDAFMRTRELRSAGIQDKALQVIRFEGSEMTDQLTRCLQYAKRWPEMKEKNIGLLLWGDTGNGKTYSAACIANYLIERHVPCLMTSFPRILQSGFDSGALIRDLKHYDMVIIDDLGTERQTEYGQEVVFAIVDELWKRGKPVIVTTNMALEEIKNPKDMTYKRIYKRILDMCVPMKFSGEDRRDKNRREKLATLSEIMRAEA